MIELILFFLSLAEVWVLFTICYAFSKKDSEGKPLIDRKLAVYSIIILAIIYFLINLRLFI